MHIILLCRKARLESGEWFFGPNADGSNFGSAVLRRSIHPTKGSNMCHHMLVKDGTRVIFVLKPFELVFFPTSGVSQQKSSQAS